MIVVHGRKLHEMRAACGFAALRAARRYNLRRRNTRRSDHLMRRPMIHAAAEPTPPSAEAEAFYADALRELSKFGVGFLVGGTYAVSAHTGITRATKDLDIFCKPADSARILERFKRLGYAI